MKKKLHFILALLCLTSLLGCSQVSQKPQIAATTPTVYEFTVYLCQGTDLTITQLISENVSCLHDYTLQVSQMKKLEEVEVLVISGAGLEDFLEDILKTVSADIIDASENIPLLCGSHSHDGHHEESHHHEEDPHIWLSVENAKIIVQNICVGLINCYPQHEAKITENCQALLLKLNDLDIYGKSTLQELASREIITFHDGFSYFAEAYDLHILEAIEEESGSEASAAELIRLTELIRNHNLPAIFTETNGSTAAASIISAETGVSCYALDMGFSGKSYFDSMYDNIRIIKEALG